MTSSYPGFIAHIKRYVTLSDQDVEIIESYMQPLVVKKRGYLLEEGEVCKSNYFVEAGCLRMFYHNEKMVEMTTQFALETWWLSDYFSFARQKPSEYFIQAVEKSVVLAIDVQLQEKLFVEVPQMERYFRIMMQRALAASQLRMKLIYELSKEEMYKHFSTSFPQFLQRVPQYMLASYLGLTPEYLSELRKRK
jgi:cAMP-binding proteins - catabolite gene activator and regulatory subunit of cAMP-dependent protein kinases